MRAFWLSAVTPYVVKYTSDYMFKSNINKVLKIMKDNNMNTLIYHIRPTNDDFYPSKLNSWSKYFSGKYSDTENTFSPPTWDTLAYVIEGAHKQDIKVHAWFNAYRVTTTKPVDMTKEEYLNNNLHPKNFAVIKNAMTYVTENYWTIHVLPPVAKTLSDNLNDQLLHQKR